MRAWIDEATDSHLSHITLGRRATSGTMNRAKTIASLKISALVTGGIVACVILPSWFVPIPLGLAGRPDSTNLRLMQPGLDARPYIAAADAFIVASQKSHARSRRHWGVPIGVVETPTSLRIQFAKKRRVALRGVFVEVHGEKPGTIVVEVSKRDMACQFQPLR